MPNNKKALLLLVLALAIVNASIISIESDGKSDDNGNSETPENPETPDSDNSKGSGNSNPNSVSSQAPGQTKKTEDDKAFEQFKAQNGKKYSSDAEETFKKANFKKNLQALKATDCTPCGVTSFFDKDEEELKKLKGLILEPAKTKEPFELPEAKAAAENEGARLLQTKTRPSAFDWRPYGAVTPVKNQGSCGSCWAFAATAFLESEGIRRGKFTNTTLLADQYIYWCTANKAWQCDGGNPFPAVDYGMAKGMPYQSTYPYVIGKDYTGICDATIIASVASNYSSSGLSWYTSSLKKSSDATIILKLLERPLIITVNANQWSAYKPDLTKTESGNIFSCSKTTSGRSMNHAVLLVGYTSTYWIVKNSWGTGWGYKGYIFVTRNRSRNCGIGYWWGGLKTTLPWVV